MKNNTRALWRLILSGLLIVFLTVAQSTANDTPDLASQIDEMFADWTGDDRPGAAVAVIRDGEIVYQNGFGMADLERSVPVTPTSVFEIGSISKQFTAMCILLLEHDGLLSLDDDIRTHIPEMPVYEETITIRHLLHHTSGIRDIETLFPLAGLPYINHYSDAAQLELIIRQTGLNFPPNSEYLYSNSGYVLLRLIVERLSGQSLREFAEQRIFTPLGMHQTVFWEQPRQIIPNRALAYSPRGENEWNYEVWHLGFAGPAGLYTTVGDLALWDANFYDNKLGGGAALIERMQTPGVLDDGESTDYAAGLVMAPFRGLPTVRHGGAWMGYRASLIRFPEQRTTVAVLSNAASINVGGGSVANLVLAAEFAPGDADGAPASFAPPATLELPTGQLAALAGSYWNESDGLLRTIASRQGKLFYVRGGGDDTELGAVGPAEFVMLGPSVRVDVTFQVSAEPDTDTDTDTEPEPPTMTVSVEGQDPLLFLPIEPSSVEDLAKIAGIYWSSDLQRELQLEVEDGQLFASWTDESDRAPATPVGSDELLIQRFVPVPWSPQDVRLRLDRYDSGKIKGLTLNCEMVRGVSFVRQL